jgi:hypothetical protein
MTHEHEVPTEEHLGGCLCGRVRYCIAAAIESVVHCHCSMCRRGAGAAVVTWVTVPVESFQFVKGVPAVYKSSDHGARSFCPGCGTQLTFFTTHAPDDVDVTLGSLDCPQDHPADRHVWASKRLPWLTLDPDLPAHEAGTPPAAES